MIDLLVRHLVENGHRIALVAHRESSVACHHFVPWSNDRSGGLKANAGNVGDLLAAVREFEPDVIHSFSRLALLTPLARCESPKMMSYQREPTGRTARIARLIHAPRLTFSACSAYIANNGRIRAGGTWSVVHNPVDVSAYSATSSVAGDAPLIFLSRIESIKGCHNAITIAKRSGRRLLIAGNHADSGREGDYWRQRIEPELGRNRIEYVGPVDDRQKNELLRHAAALVVPIEWNEPFGIVFAEALACGTPVVSAPRGALPEIVDHGVHGYLVNSIDDAVAAVENIDQISRVECRLRAEQQFASDVIARKYEELYRAMMRGHGVNAA